MTGKEAMGATILVVDDKPANVKLLLDALKGLGFAHKTEAGAVQDQSEPLTVSIRADGAIFIADTPTAYAELSPRLKAMAGAGLSKPIYVRADGKASYEIVAQVMAALSTSGFTSINLITDTGGPSSGATPDDRAEAPTP